jgi:tetratricopeptide (TPR) repeat protein
VYAITFARFQGDYMAVATFAPHAADLARAAGDKLMLGLALIILGRVAVHVEKNHAQGQRWNEQALRLFQEAESPPGFHTANACEAMGHSAQSRGALAEAGGWLEKSLRLRQQIGNEWMTQYSLYSLGNLEYDRGRLERAIDCFEAGLQIGRKYGDKRNCATAQSELAEMLIHQGNDDRAAILLREGLAIGRELAENNIVRSCLIGMATVARHAAQYEQAQAFLNESLRYAEVTNRHLRPARVQHELAFVAALQGDDAQALALYQSCIVKWQECNQPLWMASALQGFVLLAVRSAQPERALRLGAAAVALRQAHGPALGLDADLYWSGAEQTHWEQIIDAARTQLEEARARRVWGEGQAMSVEEAIRYALAEGFSSQH